MPGVLPLYISVHLYLCIYIDMLWGYVMYVCMLYILYIVVGIYIYIYACNDTCTKRYIRAYTHMCMYIYIHICIHTHSCV